jgi:hypothetical protein
MFFYLVEYLLLAIPPEGPESARDKAFRIGALLTPPAIGITILILATR